MSQCIKMESLPTNHIERIFELGEHINKGAYGEVRTHANDPNLVIKKIESLNITPNNEFTTKSAGILHELDIGYNFIHPSLCNFNNVIIDKFNVYIIMPKYEFTFWNYLDKITIDDKIEKNKITIKDKLKLIYQILHGIHFLHNNKYAHCDIKGNNILFTEDFKRATLCDFGMSIMELTRPTLGICAPGYAPPEYQYDQKLGVDWYDIPLNNQLKLDMWSFGRTICYFLYQEWILLYFSNETLEEYKRMIYSGLDILCSSVLELNLLEGCLNPIVEERLSSKQVLDLFPEEYKSLVQSSNENCYVRSIPEENPPNEWIIEIAVLFKKYITLVRQEKHTKKILRKLYAIDKYKNVNPVVVAKYAYIISEEYFNDRTELWETILKIITPEKYHQLLVDLQFNFH